MKTIMSKILSFDIVDFNQMKLRLDILIAYPTKCLNNLDICGMPLATLDLKNLVVLLKQFGLKYNCVIAHA